MIQQGRTMDFDQHGNVLIVGSWKNNQVGTMAGKAEVFRYNNVGWSPVGQGLLGDATDDRFVSAWGVYMIIFI